MQALLVSKSPPLYGEAAVHGAKNSVLPILAATLLCSTPCVLHNCPDILDVDHTLAILRALGCVCQRSGKDLYIDARPSGSAQVPAELAGTMRASSLFLGALLAKNRAASVSLPGGCPIGARPMDFHLHAFRCLGAQAEQDGSDIRCSAPALRGGKIRLPGISVGATENAILAALGAEGQTTIENAACEPEIGDLICFLRACGAKIAGEGTRTVTIEGGHALHGARYTILPDRIETATLLCACAACGGAVTVRRTDARLVQPVVQALRQSGCLLQIGDDAITIRRSGAMQVCRPVISGPYPGFPTDAMPVLLAAQLMGCGQTAFTETIFENRFLYVAQLQKLGARLRCEGRTVFLQGAAKLSAAALHADDLRGGAALVLAAMCAEGESTIFGVKHIERGYDTLEQTFLTLGAALTTVDIPN